MGLHFCDQYSLLHFSVGVVMYFWGFSLWSAFAIHTIFELLENTQLGMKFITDYFTLWPGGKTFADSHLNMFGDTVFFLAGFVSAQLLDEYYNKSSSHRSAS
jgi:hypothetical protein